MTLTTRTLDVLATFRPGPHRRQTLLQIAQECGLPMTTCHRIVHDLLDWGALERTDDGYLHVGLRLWEIGALAPRGNALRDLALPVLEDLYVATRENVQLAVREELEAVFVERLTGDRAVPVMTQVGARFPLPSTGVGRALLAFAPADVQDAALAQPVRRWTDDTTTDPSAIRALLAETRRTKVAISRREVTANAASVAAPVFGIRNEVVAAVSVVFDADNGPPINAMVPVVVAASRSISRALGAAMDGLDMRKAVASGAPPS
ncbi:MAG TPA: IclR family transcriptional regulator [Flexivirga sp.]|uniref:IclR family transcriptional regulator n=1 Tax=Flexivirga sp. TaxID=1962927 RepID=UPI002C0AE3E0|nr:IclR family transcriptional regulator [Flexivirga sp.]HWC22489.1 IclR family transcriptional regulator [Flexivirga sp.]